MVDPEFWVGTTHFTVSSPAVSAVGGVKAESAPGEPGERFPMSRSHRSSVLAALQSVQWPVNARMGFGGYGTCLGATYSKGRALIGRLTGDYEQVVRQINQAISQALGSRVFYWGSLQINYNTVSHQHTDKNNVGYSVMFLTGDFRFGAFRMSDGGEVLSDRGVLLALDGTKMHESDRFEGSRYSVVAFMHKAVSALPSDARSYLQSLGFCLPPLLRPDPVAMIDLPQSVSDRFDRTLIELCCSSDSMLGRTSEASRGCRIIHGKGGFYPAVHSCVASFVSQSTLSCLGFYPVHGWLSVGSHQH